MKSFLFLSLALAALSLTACMDTQALSVIPGTQAACVQEKKCGAAMNRCLIRAGLILDATQNCGRILPASAESTSSHLQTATQGYGGAGFVPMHHPSSGSAADLCSPLVWWAICKDAEASCRQDCQKEALL
ncbi:MAG: hypothetical protein HS115_01875 [Spirochaetales bacterium]|nr:hypothetical protein [Spirochaetales bacterium]